MTILCYHSVDDDWGSRLSIPTPDFEQQVRWLALNRQVLPLATAARMLDHRHRPPRGVAAITFDDGWAGVYDRAWPILRQAGLPFTVFVVTDTLTDDPIPVTWVDDPSGGSLTTLTREQVLELAEAGVEIGSHSRRHDDLTTLELDECVDDLGHSRQFLSDLLGRDVTSVAYPRGRHDSMVREAARRAGYRFGYSLPEVRYRPDTHSIPRVGIYPGNTVNTLRIKTSPHYLDLRLSASYQRGTAAVRTTRQLISR